MDILAVHKLSVLIMNYIIFNPGFVSVCTIFFFSKEQIKSSRNIHYVFKTCAIVYKL